MSDINALFPKTASAHEPLQAPYQALRQDLAGAGSLHDGAAAAVLSMESRGQLNENAIESLTGIQRTFRSAFASLHDKLSKTRVKNDKNEVLIPKATLEARADHAFAGFMLASDKQGKALSAQVTVAPPAEKFGMATFTLEARGAEFHNRRSVYTSEAFQNYDMDNSRIFSALFNYSIVDFDDFTRTFWRPVTISPDSTFVELLINVLTVFNGFEHNSDGKNRDWRRANLVRAIADHTILSTNLTQAIPAKQADNEDFFMTRVAAEDIDQAGHTTTTAPLLANAEDANYISLCTPAWLVKNGALDQRDGLDPGVRLDKLYIALENDTLEFSVNGTPGSEFNRAIQGDQQNLNLNWTTSALPVNASTTNVDGSDLTDLAVVRTGELQLQIKLNVQVVLNIETGAIEFQAGKPSIRSLLTKDGLVVAKTDPRYATIQTALSGVEEVGYTLKAYRSNADRRQRGQLINIRQFAENVVVPWRDPIAAERPAAGQTDQDTSDLTALISATRVRVQNESVTALFDAEEVIKRTPVDVEYDSFATPSTLGVGRHYVLPYYHYEQLDAKELVDSIRSGQREADLQAALVATLRNRVAVAYTESQYKAASDALSGGTAPKPKIALVTDPVIARYIIEPGELRTLVDFELIVVPILDFRMRGKMKLVFITDDGGTDVNYLNFGYLFWSPEHVLVANMTRTGGYNRETQVQPRYRHYVACPIMLSFDVTNIAEVLGKVSVNVTTTANGGVAPTPAP